MRNKSKFISFLALALMLSFLASPMASAQRMNNQNQTQKESAESRMQARITNMKALMRSQINRSENALNRMDRILEKIETRKVRLEAAGVDLTDINEMIADAQAFKAAAEEALEEAKADLAALDTAITPSTTVRAFMASMKELKKQLIALHRSLMLIVKEMRQAAAEVEDSEDAGGTSEETSN